MPYVRRALAGVLILAALGLPSSAQADHIREGDVRFKVTCSFDQAAEIDPIVHPGTVGVSHRHDFFGRRRMTENVTTYEELTALDRTTCNDPDDLAAYWTPSVLLTDGTWASPGRMAAYYRRGNKHGDIQPYPDGLKIVSDNGLWHCNRQNPQPEPYDDCGGKAMTLQVDFPDCWDGQSLDSADHRSHMAYSAHDGSANVCPASHPVQVPRLTTYVNFPGVTSGGQIAGLSSGATTTGHGDFFNGWDPARLAERVETCLNGLRRCRSGG